MRRGSVAAVGCALLAAALPASATGTYMPLRLQVPGPGQITVGVAQLRVHGAAPKRLGVRLHDSARLGHRYSGIYATYRRRHGRVTALTFVTLLLRRERAAASLALPLASASGEEEDAVDLGLFFLFGGMRKDGFTQLGSAKTGGDGKPEADLFTIVKQLGNDAAISGPRRMRRLLEYGGVEAPPASHPADLGDSFVDTGHYDDGHSFGWHTAGVKQAVGDWVNLSRSADAAYADLVETIERRLGEDLDGDGEVGDARGGGGPGGTIETEVGAPVIG